MLKKIEEKIDRASLKTKAFAIAATSALYSFAPVTSHADINTNAVTIVGGDDPTSLFGNVIGLVLGLVQFVGIVMIILGVVQFIQNSHEDQVNKRIQAITLAGSGALLVGLRVLLQAMGVIG